MTTASVPTNDAFGRVKGLQRALRPSWRGEGLRARAVDGAPTTDLPPAFFEVLLGPLGPGCGALFLEGHEDLETASRRMTQMIAQRLELEDGQRVLDLNAGHGGLTLALAEIYPSSEFVACTANEQRARYVAAAAQARGLTNVKAHPRRDAWNAGPSATPGLAGRGRFDRALLLDGIDDLFDIEPALRAAEGLLRQDSAVLLQTIEPTFADESRFSRAWRVAERHHLAPQHLAATATHWRWRLEQQKDFLRPLLQRVDTGTEYERNVPSMPQFLRSFRSQRSPRANWARTIQRWRDFFLAREVFFGHRGGSHRGSDWGGTQRRLVPSAANGATEPVRTLRPAQTDAPQGSDHEGQAVTP